MRTAHKKIAIAVVLPKEHWVELVHSLATKIEYVKQHPEVTLAQKRPWLKTLNSLYDYVQGLVEAEGIEC